MSLPSLTLHLTILLVFGAICLQPGREQILPGQPAVVTANVPGMEAAGEAHAWGVDDSRLGELPDDGEQAFQPGLLLGSGKGVQRPGEDAGKTGKRSPGQ